MKKILLSVALLASVSCSVIFAQPYTSGNVSPLFAYKAVTKSASSQSACTLEMIGNTLTMMVDQKMTPFVSFENSSSALNALKNLNSKYCPNSKITVGNNSQGLTQVSGSGFTSYQCWAKSGLIVCAILSNDVPK